VPRRGQRDATGEINRKCAMTCPRTYSLRSRAIRSASRAAWRAIASMRRHVICKVPSKCLAIVAPRFREALGRPVCAIRPACFRRPGESAETAEAGLGPPDAQILLHEAARDPARSDASLGGACANERAGAGAVAKPSTASRRAAAATQSATPASTVNAAARSAIAVAAKPARAATDRASTIETATAELSAAGALLTRRPRRASARAA
jgi:hypothetical protein